MKNNIVARIFYLLSILGFVGYLITQKSVLMFFGGLFLTIASIIVIITNKKDKK